MPIDSVLAQELTPEQRAAATDAAREVLALACAGSGKSRTLAYRIARLIAQGEDPKGIVAFTFTEKAADSIKLQVSRALAKAGLDPSLLGAMYLGTIHSYCQFVLGEMDATYRQFDVLDENRLKLYLISRYIPLQLVDIRTARAARYFDTIREVSNAWKNMNDEMIAVEDIARGDAILGRILQSLADRMRQDQFIDFSLMIRRVAEALAAADPDARRAVSSLRHLMVDEYQDVNPAQEHLIRELHGLAQTLFAVGDDDQAIYAWRGADVNNILTFRERYPGCSVHTLPRNFRSTRAIVAAANGFVQAELGPSRITKTPQAEDPDGPRDFRTLWFRTREEEANWVADRIQRLLGTAYREINGQVRGLTLGDFAILMRSTRGREGSGVPRHAAFTGALAARRLAYSLEAGGGAFDRAQPRALRDAFGLLRDGSPTRETAEAFFNSSIRPAFPRADFNAFTRVLTDWSQRIHEPRGGARRRVFPQQLVHDLLSAFGVHLTPFDSAVMQDLGVFSRIIQDVEAVYLSIDSADRYREILNFLENVAESGYDTSTDDVLRRPDLVTVATVHKVKGLEFPVVFVVDVEARRFPGDRDSYSGWLPPDVIQPAVNRGAYHATRAEDARTFYTAITRAERYLHVSGSESLPGGRRSWQRSPFTLRLSHTEVSNDPAGIPAGLAAHPPSPRIDETVVPTTYSDIRYYLACPRNYQFRKSFGFSPPIPELFGFGKTVHTAVGKLHERYSNRAPSGQEAEELALQVFHLKHVAPSRDPVNRPGAYERARTKAGEIVKSYAETYSEDFTRERQVEARFEIPIEQAVISGAIDLLLKVDENNNILEAHVVDFKAMAGGESPEDNEQLHWTELALQVQLYAKGAREVLGENARTGAVHLLKDNQRIQIPVTDDAIDAAVKNVEWAVARILARDFPMRPHPAKCDSCDFRALCSKAPEQFTTTTLPLPVHIPGDMATERVRAFSQFVEDGDA